MNNNFHSDKKKDLYRSAPSFESGFEDDFENGFDDDYDDSFPSYNAPPVRSRRRDDAFAAPISSRTADYNEEEFDFRPEKNSAPPPTSFGTRNLFIALAVMCILASCLMSSGDLIRSAGGINDKLSAKLDLSAGFDSIITNVINTAHGMPKVYALPMNESPAMPPNEDNYSSYVDEEGITHDTYIDETISVDCSRKRYYVNDVSTIAAVARIKIAHPTQLRSAFAGGQYGSTRMRPSDISKQVNAIISINGELYNYAGRNALLIRQGTLYRDTGNKYRDMLFIDSNGDFSIVYDSVARETGLFNNPENPIYQTVNFGPVLVRDGEVVDPKSVQENCRWRNPRSAIGQTGKLEYIIVAVEGRAEDSKGLTTLDLAELMKQLGCTQAYNLDGGQSSIMVFHNKIYNRISNGNERTFSDILYFGSALPQ